VDITSRILEAAIGNARNHSLRAYDAVQLASAIAVRTSLLVGQGNVIDFTLISADIALNDAARLEGLQVKETIKMVSQQCHCLSTGLKPGVNERDF